MLHYYHEFQRFLVTFFHAKSFFGKLPSFGPIEYFYASSVVIHIFFSEILCYLKVIHSKETETNQNMQKYILLWYTKQIQTGKTFTFVNRQHKQQR